MEGKKNARGFLTQLQSPLDVFLAMSLFIFVWSKTEEKSLISHCFCVCVRSPFLFVSFFALLVKISHSSSFPRLASVYVRESRDLFYFGIRVVAGRQRKPRQKRCTSLSNHGATSCEFALIHHKSSFFRSCVIAVFLECS